MVRLIDERGEQVGIVSLSEALAKANQAEMDLVEIGPTADPPVAKIIEWGKYRYQQTKQEQKSRKKHKVQDIKQIRLGLKIGQHDLDVKLRKVRQFIADGDKVKFSLMFRGREITHPELGKQLLDKIAAELAEIAVVDQQPQLLGRYLTMTIHKK